MRLETFQVKNCFGFRDSTRVNMGDAHNFIYVLGRNSSGKSSFLNALKYFESGVTPEKEPRFHNFRPTGDEPLLIAEFSIEERKISLDKFLEAVKKILKETATKSQFGSSIIDTHNLFQELIEGVSKIYKSLIDQLNASKRVRIEKTGSGGYRFLEDESHTRFQERSNAVDRLLQNATGKEIPIPGTQVRRFERVYFQEIENLLFLQFPRMILFNETYSLKEQLPDRITNEVFRSDKSGPLLKAFMTFLGTSKVQTFLSTDDPDEIIEIQKEMQTKVNGLVARVNKHRGNDGANKDLLEVNLHPNKNGLQLTFRTDKKKSFYSHLSENTKFLFAYYLYQGTYKIEGDILLFDEPSNGFHPTAQEFILNFLKALTEKNNLVIVATHSEYLIDPMRLSGIRIMDIDNDNYMFVRNHFYNQARDKGDYLALQPILDAIGLRYGQQINIHDKVIITEGITDLLYLRAFNSILGTNYDLNIAPARSASHIMSLIPLFISQGISFKIVLDRGDAKENIRGKIQGEYGIEDKFIWEVPVPAGFEKIRTSGIEDLFSRNDFTRILPKPIEEKKFSHVTNSFYLKEEVYKRTTASQFYENHKSYKVEDFEDHTLTSFRSVLDFCNKDEWFNM